jgi:hypothetical protein
MVRSLASSLIVVLAAAPVWAQQPPPAPPAPTPAPAPAQPPVGTPSAAPRPDAVTPPPPLEEEKTTEEKGAIGVAVRGRFIFLPSALLNLFLEHSTSLAQYSVGAAFVRRKGNFDIEFGLEYANVSPKDGYYLEKGKDPSQQGQYPDKIHFDNFSMISADATFIWHSDIIPTVQVRYGAGIGLGFLLGDIIGTKQMCTTGTSTGDLDDPNANGKCTDLSGTTAPKSKPPILPIVHLLAGIRFKLIDQLSLNVEVGIRDLPFVGLNIGYFF